MTQSGNYSIPTDQKGISEELACEFRFRDEEAAMSGEAEGADSAQALRWQQV